MKPEPETAKKYRKLYKQNKFHEQYMYNGPLGPVCTAAGTSLVLWSPVAESVRLNLYHTDAAGEPFEVIDMAKGVNGTWTFSTPECLHGVYYDLTVLTDGREQQAGDPYARACGANSVRDMFVDLVKTDPEGWEEDRAPGQPAAPVIYEMHVKEFSWDPAGGFSEPLRGKYLAFTDSGSKGMQYLKELGVTHVQLMPIYDFGSVDETGSREQFNWGYDPVNYNIPEGSYATDAHRGEVRVRECKEMIRALHRCGLRVVMDVVYNHTYSLDTALQQTAPWYFYRTNEKGELSNGSGCGNDTASERPMCAKYILDSVIYWAEEYHIDGFRFDLMGLIDVRVMNRIRAALDERFGAGEKILYGEPWAAGMTAVEGKNTLLADRSNFAAVDRGIGLFNGDIRDAVKGSVFNAKSGGFVNGGKGLEERIAKGAAAGRYIDSMDSKDSIDSKDSLEALSCELKAASQAITYVSAHDNHTLWDKLTITTPDSKLRLRQNRLAAAICMTCQGIPFLLSGEEFLRTKKGLDNSYDAPVEINRIDWALPERNRDTVDYYRGLIGLRKHLPGLYDPTGEACKRIHILEAAAGVVMFTVDNSPSERWPELLVIYNSTHKKIRRNLPDGEWEILADDKNSFLWKQEMPETASGSVSAAPVGACVLGRIIYCCEGG